MEIATGQRDEEYDTADEANDPRAVHRGQMGGLQRVGARRADRLTKKERA